MKINRTLFCLNNNPLYVGFWKKVSEIWYKGYGVTPTLFFTGKENEIKSLDLSDKYGEIICLPKIDSINTQRNWSVTWSVFYGATMFPDDICLTSGIDQIPLGNQVIENIENLNDESYVVCFTDAYENHASVFPSSYHIGKGKKYKEIYQIDDDWEKEVHKLLSSKDKYLIGHDDWGLDEAYSSDMLLKSKNEHLVFWKGFFHNVWVPKRLDRGTKLSYDLNLLKSGWYTELHSPRPYEQYCEYIDKLVFDRYGF